MRFLKGFTYDYEQNKDITENYLKVIINEKNIKVIASAQITSPLKGSFMAPKDFDYEKELSEVLSKKYLTQKNQ